MTTVVPGRVASKATTLLCLCACARYRDESTWILCLNRLDFYATSCPSLLTVISGVFCGPSGDGSDVVAAIGVELRYPPLLVAKFAIALINFSRLFSQWLVGIFDRCPVRLPRLSAWDRSAWDRGGGSAHDARVDGSKSPLEAL